MSRINQTPFQKSSFEEYLKELQTRAINIQKAPTSSAVNQLNLSKLTISESRLPMNNSQLQKGLDNILSDVIDKKIDRPLKNYCVPRKQTNNPQVSSKITSGEESSNQDRKVLTQEEREAFIQKFNRNQDLSQYSQQELLDLLHNFRAAKILKEQVYDLLEPEYKAQIQIDKIPNTLKNVNYFGIYMHFTTVSLYGKDFIAFGQNNMICTHKKMGVGADGVFYVIDHDKELCYPNVYKKRIQVWNINHRKDNRTGEIFDTETGTIVPKPYYLQQIDNKAKTGKEN